MSIIKQLEDHLTPLLAAGGMELVDVQIMQEHGKKVVRVFLDKEGGVNLTDCSEMSLKIGDAVDAANIIRDNYVLEVSSPGMDRVLKKEKDFLRFKGKKAQVSVFEPINGQRNFCGEILSVENGAVKINDVTGKQVDILIEKMARARLEPEI
jgi:ribosome maturation factor RimP